jgi:hypothetical protein
MRIITIYRPKRVITLPPLNKYLMEVALTSKKKALYKQTRKDTIQTINRALSSGKAAGFTYLNAFKKINELRFICNHELRYRIYTFRGIRPRQDENYKNTVKIELDQLFENSDGAYIICDTNIKNNREMSTINLSP